MFCPNLRRKQAVEAAKHPTTTTFFTITLIVSASLLPPKEITPIAPPNNDKWPEDQISPLSLTSHQPNAQPQNGLP
jgi:hypothetical protein